MNRKYILLLIFLVFGVYKVHANELVSIYNKLDSVVIFDFNKIDSITFSPIIENSEIFNSDKKELQFKMVVNQKMGSISNFNMSKLDSVVIKKKYPSNKRGGVVFRVDDTQSVYEMDAMSKIFDKYGFKMSNILIWDYSTANIQNFMHQFQARGHEIADHTAHHNTGFADMMTNEQVAIFYGLPGVRKIEGKRVYFKWVYPDLKDCKVNDQQISTISGSSTIKGNFNIVNSPTEVIYTNEFGWVHLKNKTENSATATDITTYSSTQQLIFSSNSTQQLYKTPISNIYLDEDATSALLLATRTISDDWGFNRPRFWAFLWNNSAEVRAEMIKKVGPKYGYVGSVCYNNQQLYHDMNYNQHDSIARWNQSPFTFFTENLSVLEAERHIVDRVAKHQIAVDCCHFWCKSMPEYSGTSKERIQQYLLKIDSILQFCYQNNINVLTHEQASILMYDTPQDSSTNMMPPLYNDITKQGFPDGYTLKSGTAIINNDGVEVDKSYSLRRKGNGTLFTITDIGGFDKGKNIFSFYAKGPENTTITISITGGGETRKSSLKIVGAANQYIQFETSLDIPQKYDKFDIKVDISDNPNQNISLSGMYFGKPNLEIK